MPHYFFHVHDGQSTPDDEGTEFKTLADARLEAVRLAGCLVDEHAPQIAEGQDWYLEVTDETGLILFRVDVLASGSAATRVGH